MATKSFAKKVNENDVICQGDIFKNVKYRYFLEEDNDTVKIVELVFPLAVIISQACDVIAMSEIIKNQKGKLTKFMPSILMCPIYNKNDAKEGENIKQVFKELKLDIVEDQGNKTPVFHKDDLKVANRDWHYRIHDLTVIDKSNKKLIIENAILDFKHYFAVPMTYLERHKKDRDYSLEDIFAEQLTLKFCTYLSRVAIPDE